MKNKLVFNPAPSVKPLYGAALIFIGLPFLLSFIALFTSFELHNTIAPLIWRISYQSFMAAFFGTLLSCLFGYIFAHSLFRLPFWGQKYLISLLALTMVLPSIIAIEALAAIYGRQGMINQFLAFLGIDKIQFIYNFSGILIAFTFFNIAFFTLIFFERLQSIPKSYWYNAQVFNFSYGQEILHIEWPALKNIATHNGFFIFSLCFTSFAPVLILGGGKVQTLTVALYHALSRLDMPLVLQIAMVQFVFSLLALSLLFFIKNPHHRLEQGFSHHPSPARSFGWIYAPIIIAIGLYIFLPLLTIIYKGILQNFWLWLINPVFYKALWTSLSLSFCSAVISLSLAFILARHREQFLTRFFSYLPLMLPSFVLMAGLFILLQGHINLFHYRRLFIIFSSALLALPLSLQLILAPLRQVYKSQHRLAQSLNLNPLIWFRLILWPQLRSVFLRSLSIIMAFCFGEFGVIAFLGSQDFKTLPLLLYELMGRRRFGDAEGLACLLLIIYIFLFVLLNQRQIRIRN